VLINLNSGRAFDYKDAVNSYIAKDRDIRNDYELFDSDWESIKMVSDWLKSFRSATTEMSTTKRPMLSSTQAIFRGLQGSLRTIISELPEDVSPELKEGLCNAHKKLSDYYSKYDQSPFPVWAACRSFSSLLM
jgi:hypothetical protein